MPSESLIPVSLRNFMLNLAQITLTLILIIVIVGLLGLNTASFVALFASASLAIGMALGGTLQNFAGGVMVLMLKPYKVGDYIAAEGQEGTVKEIRLSNTVLNTPDNKTIYVPNGGISSSVVNNFSSEPSRRVEWTFNISYGDDYDKAKSILEGMLKKDKRVYDSPAPFVALNTLGESALTLVVRAWVKTADYWDVYFEFNERAYKTFPSEGINFPSAQLDVRLNRKE